MSAVKYSCKTLLAVVACALGLSSVQAAITWNGMGIDDNLTTADNWVGGIAPTLNASSANSDVIFTGSTRTSPLTTVADQSYRTVVFDSGADAFTFGGTTEFIFNNTGSSTRASANNSDNKTQTFNVDVGMRRVNLSANSGDIVFNNRVRLFTTTTTMGGAKNIYLNGGLTGSADFFASSSVSNGGTIFIPVASTDYSNAISIQNTNLEIANGNALGDGATDRVSRYVEINGFNVGSTPVLALTNNITVGKYVYLDIRGTFAPHIVNKSGTNEITNDIEFERGGGTLTAGVDKFSLQSDGGLFKISGNIVRTNEEDMGTAISLALQGNGNGLISGNIGGIAGSGAFTPPTLSLFKDGGGDWTLSGNNIYTGTTTVNQGTLLVNGTHTGGGGYTVASGGTLAGVGTIGATVSVSAGGTLAPGAGIGTLSTGATAISGTLKIDFNSTAQTIDMLQVTGTLDITGASITFQNLGAGSLAGGPYVFASYGSLTGNPFSAITGLPAGYSINYHYLGGNQIALVSGLPGDFDNDGDVDGADFIAWQTNFPTASSATQAQGDADGDGDVDGADFGAWQTNFPFTPGPGAAMVPEPVGVLLLGMGGVGLIWVRHRWAEIMQSPPDSGGAGQEAIYG